MQAAEFTKPGKLDVAQILAIIPVPFVFMISPFLMDGLNTWLGWTDVALTVLWIAIIAVASVQAGRFRLSLRPTHRILSAVAIVLSVALLTFYILGVLKAFGIYYDVHPVVPIPGGPLDPLVPIPGGPLEP